MAKSVIWVEWSGEAERKGARWLMPLLVGLFFLSGLAGLVYQVLWLRLLALVFGVTVWAASTVLAAFMAGLALGSLAAGRFADRVHHPLLWYGVAEALVGLSAVATPLLLQGVERLYVGLHPILSENPSGLTALRFGLSFAVLLVPTTLMGATLPIIVKSSLLRAEGLGEKVGLLYGTNTAGAVAGTLLAGFVLIGGVGIRAAFGLAAMLNLLVGVVAVAAARRLGRWSEGETESKRDGGREARDSDASLSPSLLRSVTPSPDRARRAVLLVFTLSGLASLALEVVWFRVLALFLQVTTYAFTVMLATVLLGIALGSYLATALLRRRLDWLLLLAGLELAIGVAATLSLAALGSAHALVGWAEGLLGRPIAGRLSMAPIASFLALFPTTLLLGVAFPIGLRMWAAADDRPTADTGRRIGLFYSLNVFGAILGSLLAGFILLPWLGSRASLALISALSLGGGLLLLAVAPRTRRALAAGGVGVLAFLAAAASMPDPFASALAARYPGERLLWQEEGVQTTVSVHETPDGTRVLYLDGLHQANDQPGMVLIHQMIGHLPMALHPDPKDVLVVGLGGGATPGAISRYPGASLDIVELSGSVARGSDWFRHINRDVLRRPNVRLRVDDGRNYLLLTARRYDVITADIILPFHAGAGNLYSAEYFRLARNALKEDGLMLQWLGWFPETQHRLIMRTFLSVFPETTLWFEGILMVGSKRPLQLDPAAYARKLADPATREVLESVGLGSFEALLGQYWAGPDELRAYAGPGPILTDDRPMVEYFLSLPRGEPDADLSGVRGDPRRLVPTTADRTGQ